MSEHVGDIEARDYKQWVHAVWAVDRVLRDLDDAGLLDREINEALTGARELLVLGAQRSKSTAGSIDGTETVKADPVELMVEGLIRQFRGERP